MNEKEQEAQDATLSLEQEQRTELAKAEAAKREEALRVETE